MRNFGRNELEGVIVTAISHSMNRRLRTFKHLECSDMNMVNNIN